MIREQKFPVETNYKWYDISNLSEEDSNRLQIDFHFTPDMISYISDRHERPHYDYDTHTHIHLLVYDVPIWPTKTIKHFTAHPVTFLVSGQNIFTFHTESTSYVFDEFNDNTSRRDLSLAQDVTELLMKFLLYLSQYFQRAVTQLDAERNSLDQKLSGDINNKDLVELSNIEKSLVYLSSSIQTNLMMLHSLKMSELDFTKPGRERLDDVLIESNQAAEMVKISQQVTQTLSATSNNMMNNNLNDTMKFLTVWSLVLTIPTILTGFYGMNVSLPVGHSSSDWIAIIVVTVFLMGWLIVLMKRHHFF
ncbi:MIT family metal ion transporter CorA [Lactobacillus helsingborgensis]|uniref:Magnesium transporter CorA family protein n=1 Tax=Lactobacillus helsingborgensis TaxID=1218494 RepID=A0A0F4M4Z5_9LACO|nr:MULTISPECIES: magnesium transporter CorA family protein [Lactobacillus]MBI0109554.1 magnesium transporter CorA family protein [Lactobacillus sp. W8093]AWN32981.1 magnesium transporter CorA family protein [Lactobacillus helsingborgensis]KJY65920.1 MIT family metal ion transporter CorA [Lactobacillus helsingborgensis]MBC6356784.1 magnesium transporter CorA family protein [Lactobacillus helsingborgensis]MCT6828102.1 magnesium transporter CorA family protein [Lactobacillus helsingborgensis]